MKRRAIFAQGAREVTILLVGDDPGITVPLVTGLQEAGFRVLQAPDGAWGLQLARAAQPDLVLLDVTLPRMDGLTVCRILRRESPVLILLLTAGDGEGERIRGLELGADGCIVKPWSLPEVLARVRALLRRRGLNGSNGTPPRDRIVVGDLVLDRATRQVWRGGQRIRLRRLEFDLLCALMENAGRAISRQELFQRVWGLSWMGDSRTLDVHIRWLRQRLGDNPSAPRYIETVRGYGHRFVAPGGSP